MMPLIGCVILAISLTSCTANEITPKVPYSIHEKALFSLPAAFAPIGEEERQTDWGREYVIGSGFGKKLDLYRAITAFERAKILAPNDAYTPQMDYQILLAYYLGKQYDPVDLFFSKSSLQSIDSSFPPYHDLLLILYDTYKQKGNTPRAESLLARIKHHYPKTFQKLLESDAMQRADFSALQTREPLLVAYDMHKKSSVRAALFNALLPGLGYFYLGQVHTSITALLVNALFFAAVFAFFRKRAIAATLIFFTFGIGWYVGGIQGAIREAKFYNARVYEELAAPIMNQEGMFPIHMLEYGF